MDRVITIMMDGNAWLCHDERFVDLAESEIFGWGDTPQEALEDYMAVDAKQTEDANSP